MSGQVLLTPLLAQPFGREEKEREKREREDFRERSSTFSLDFSAIGLLNPGETRGKVDPHCKSYAWVLVLWSFDKLWEVGVFFYLNILCLKSHENGFKCCEAGYGHGFRFQEVESMLNEEVVLR